jgi:hypothetical protein
MQKRKLRMFLDDSTGTPRLFACLGKSCKQDPLGARKVQCSDCVEGRNEETIEQLLERLEAGKA